MFWEGLEATEEQLQRTWPPCSPRALGISLSNLSLHLSQMCRQQTRPVWLFRVSLHKPFPIAGLPPSQLPAGGSTLPAPPALSPALPAPASASSPAGPQPGAPRAPLPSGPAGTGPERRGQSWPGPSALCYLKGTQPFLHLVYPQFRRVEEKQTWAFCSPASPSVSPVLLPRAPSALSSLRDPAQHPAG